MRLVDKYEIDQVYIFSSSRDKKIYSRVHTFLTRTKQIRINLTRWLTIIPFKDSSTRRIFPLHTTYLDRNRIVNLLVQLLLFYHYTKFRRFSILIHPLLLSAFRSSPFSPNLFGSLSTNESIQRLTRSKLSKWDPRKHVYNFRSRNAPVSLFLPHNTSPSF